MTLLPRVDLGAATRRLRARCPGSGPRSQTFEHAGRLRQSPATLAPRTIGSGKVGAARLEVDGVERRAGGHDKTVALGPAKPTVGADLGKKDLSDADTVGREDVDAVVAGPDPARSRIHVALDVASDAVSKTLDHLT